MSDMYDGEVKIIPMSKQQIFGRVCEILHNEVHVPVDTSIRMATMMSDSLGLDSLDLIDLAKEVEREFGIEIPDADSYRMNTYTVGCLCEVIERELEKKFHDS